MVAIHAFGSSGAKLQRRGASAITLCISLAACDGTDATWPRRVAELGSVETPTAPGDPLSADAGATVVSDAGETPQESVDAGPVSTPTTADAGTPVPAFDCSSLPGAPLS